jgi:hypothetical protein
LLAITTGYYRLLHISSVDYGNSTVDRGNSTEDYDNSTVDYGNSTVGYGNSTVGYGNSTVDASYSMTINFVGYDKTISRLQ